MDQEDAFAEGGDVGHVVGGEEDRGVVFAVVFAEEDSDGGLGVDVEAEGGFVEEQYGGAVEEGGEEFALHAFAEREFSDGLGELFFEAEHLGEFGDAEF